MVYFLFPIPYISPILSCVISPSSPVFRISLFVSPISPISRFVPPISCISYLSILYIVSRKLMSGNFSYFLLRTSNLVRISMYFVPYASCFLFRSSSPILCLLSPVPCPVSSISVSCPVSRVLSYISPVSSVAPRIPRLRVPCVVSLVSPARYILCLVS